MNYAMIEPFKQNSLRGFKLIRLAILVLLILNILSLDADAKYQLSSEPMLMLNTGMHNGEINAMAVDSSDTYLVTGSQDKTVLVWSLKENELHRQLHFPKGEGAQGIIKAVAISPDGNTVVFGGDTFTEEGVNYHIYIFDRATGNMKKRIGNLPGVIKHIKYSPDGSFFAVGLSKGGIRIFDSTRFTLLASDESFSGTVNGLDIDNKGNIFVAYERYVVVYDKSLQVIAKNKEEASPSCFSVTPDGSLVAVCRLLDPIKILSGKSLEYLYDVDKSGIEHSDMIDIVVWSKNGQMLFAGGRRFNNMVIWTNKARQSHWKQIHIEDAVSSLIPLNNGGFVAATRHPIINVKAYSLKDISDKSPMPYFTSKKTLQSQQFFDLSHDGNVIRVEYKVNIDADNLKQGALNTYVTFNLIKGPIYYKQDDHLKFTRLFVGPIVRKKPLKDFFDKAIREDRENVAGAGSHDESFFIFSVASDIYCFDSTGKTLWEKKVQNAIWSLNIPKSGKIAVAEHKDGTYRWYRTSDGKEIAAMYLRPAYTIMSGEDYKKRLEMNRLDDFKVKYDWVVWTPDGYYYASPKGESMIGWHVNRGWDRSALFYSVGQFRSKYYKPEEFAKLIEASIKGEGISRFEAAMKPTKLPPTVSILEPIDGIKTSLDKVTLKYTVDSPSGEKVKMKVMLNGRPVSKAKDLVIEKADSASVAKQSRASTTVPLSAGENNISVIAISESGLTSAPVSVTVIKKEEVTTSQQRDAFIIKPKLYVLAVGVSKFKKRPQSNLQFASKDASDFVNAVKALQGKLYREVVSKVLLDDKATRDTIIDGLQWLKRQTTQHDVAMIFMSSHGINESGQYYVIPSDYDPARVEASSVLYTYIKDAVASIPGKVIVFMDTCHAGDVLGRRGAKAIPADINRVVNELVSAENGAVVFTSSTGRQQSFEDEKWGNGAFTKALIEGLRGKADFTKKGVITINMLDLYISERVKELTGGKQTPTTAKPDTIQDFPVAVVK